jgi:transposase
MYPRQKMIKQGGNVYRYVDIVEGYRRKDGKVAQKIVAKLGPMSELSFINLQVAFRAARCGKSVIVPDKIAAEIVAHDKVRQNLHYLDICVIKEMWDYWNLDELFANLIGEEERSICSGRIIQILTIQRCVDPQSKLYAQEWFPTTALPELSSVKLGRFNNVRVHRALEALYKCTPKLQEKLPKLYKTQQPQFAALFMDVTNTYFTGHGCEKAERSRTKEGIRNKFCIGIVLLANENGYPLRWTVIPGKTKDHIAMADMVDSLKGINWTNQTPLVCDRAMGQQKSLNHLCASGIQFITAAHVDAIESFTKDVPWKIFAGANIDNQANSRNGDIAKVIRMAEDSKIFEKIDDQLFVMDIGEVTITEDDTKVGHKRKGIQHRLEEARQLNARLENGEFKAIKELAQGVGRSPVYVSQLLKLFRLLNSEVQKYIHAMPSDIQVTGSQLEYILKAKDTKSQFERLREIIGPLKNVDRDNDDKYQDAQPLQLRLVAYFNPQMFVDQRRRTAEHREDLEKFISDLNTELAEAKRTRKEEPTRRKIFQQLDKHNWRDLFEVAIESIPMKDGKTFSFRCTLTCKEKAWERRHRYNGFVLLLVQKDLNKTPREIAMLYRQKDMVEKDFQCIKSVIKLRPVYHRTNEKVEAHVTLCMIALLLERTLEKRLDSNGIKKTATSSLDELATCHLNLMMPAGGGQCFYSVTEATIGQMDILKALNFEHYVDDTIVSQRIFPRIDTTKKNK